MRKLGFGICGLGFMGRTYFGHLQQHAEAHVTAVFDEREENRRGEWLEATGNIARAGGQRVAMEGVRAYAALEHLLNDPSVDVVAVTLPTPLHGATVCAALQAGKHVICEKPMALKLRDCDRMIAAAQRCRRTLMIAQCIRFWPQYEAIQSLVDGGEIGAIRFASLRRVGPPPTYSTGNWLMDHLQSGGALFDLHIHDVDFAHHLLGVPQSVSAVGCRGPSGGIDHVVATHRYDDGRYALLEGGWVFTPPWQFDMAITVVGERGTLAWSMRGGPEVLAFESASEPRRIAVDGATGWTRELDYLIDCLHGGAPVARCLPESSRVSIGLALLEQRSVETGRAWRVPKCIRRSGCGAD
ncbi:MAG: Myo-inositol 2-dehydrogenase [Phycisphaerae bacterium]|nr:Myo-inositol 2-dehydrogenase [Phycisphaerae bacterium]